MKEDEDDEDLNTSGNLSRERFLEKYRRLIAVLIPFLIVQFAWWAYAIRHSVWSKFEERYAMTVTMIFGSIVAGMTSEGGGAIAFPVMTLALKIAPDIAKDFSLMIQSCGMSAAAFTILFMHVQIEYNSLVFCSIGAVGGAILGFEVVDKRLTPNEKKMMFVCIWFSFAFALFLLNTRKSRKTFRKIPNPKWWTYLILILTGFFGGLFTSFAGSGVDICSFSMLTLLFRVSEKVATPTSVILMAFNTVFGFYWREVIQRAVSQDAWDYFIVCVPIVVIGAPIGSLFGTHFHRLVLAALVYIIDIVALVSAFAIIKPTGKLLGLSLGILGAGFIFFLIITKFGDRQLNKITENSKKQSNEIDLQEIKTERERLDETVRHM